MDARQSVAEAPAASAEEEEEVYSVWAIPPPDVTTRIEHLTSSLRSEFPSASFNPHITLVGAIRLTASDAIRRLHAAASGLRPFTARVAAVSRGSFFYQCVFLLIDPTPEVNEASAHCCAYFGYQNSTPYMPHLSLLYADLTDEEKESARKRAEALDGEICGISFEVSEIALYKTDTEDKSLESWEKVEVCHLRNPA